MENRNFPNEPGIFMGAGIDSPTFWWINQMWPGLTKIIMKQSLCARLTVLLDTVLWTIEGLQHLRRPSLVCVEFVPRWVLCEATSPSGRNVKLQTCNYKLHVYTVYLHACKASVRACNCQLHRCNVELRARNLELHGCKFELHRYKIQISGKNWWYLAQNPHILLAQGFPTCIPHGRGFPTLGNPHPSFKFS